MHCPIVRTRKAIMKAGSTHHDVPAGCGDKKVGGASSSSRPFFSPSVAFARGGLYPLARPSLLLLSPSLPPCELSPRCRQKGKRGTSGGAIG